MVDIARKSTFGRNFLIVLGGLLFLGGAYFGGKQLYRKYEPMRLASRARSLADAGDDIRAHLTLRRALALNPNDAASVRLMAELADLKAVRMGNVLFITTEPRAEKIRQEEASTPDVLPPAVPVAPAGGPGFGGGGFGMIGGAGVGPALGRPRP